MKNLYEPAVANEIRDRLARLQPSSEPLWGKMNVAQALAHCALAMENALGDFILPRHLLGRLVGRFAKRSILAKGTIDRSAPTHPTVLVTDARIFEVERDRLRRAIDRFSSGPATCTRHPHFFFGPMTPIEWARFEYIHLDHHFRQFQV